MRGARGDRSAGRRAAGADVVVFQWNSASATSAAARGDDVWHVRNSRAYYQYKSQDELTAWNNLFVPITQGT
jgi:hypothetical protein